MRFCLLLLAGFAACVLSGCRNSQPADLSLPSAGSITGAWTAAEYVRNEPAVKEVRPWTNSYGDGLVIRTEHYQLYTTLLEPLMLRQVPAFLEAAYQAYQSQLPQPLPSSRPLEVYLFATRNQWEHFTHRTMGSDTEVYLRIQRGAYTANGICVAYNIGRKQTFAVIGHEGWHQFNQRLFAYRLPSWLDEGIATLFETCQYTQGRFVFEPQRNLMRLGSLKKSMQQNQLIPLPQLIVLNPGQVLSNHGEDSAVVSFYAQNYALVRFLREYDYGIRLRNYHALLLGGANGTWPLNGDLTALAADRPRPLTVRWNTLVAPALFDYYIEPDMKTLEKEYREFCARIVYRVQIK